MLLTALSADVISSATMFAASQRHDSASCCDMPRRRYAVCLMMPAPMLARCCLRYADADYALFEMPRRAACRRCRHASASAAAAFFA